MVAISRQELKQEMRCQFEYFADNLLKTGLDSLRESISQEMKEEFARGHDRSSSMAAMSSTLPQQTVSMQRVTTLRPQLGRGKSFFSPLLLGSSGKQEGHPAPDHSSKLSVPSVQATASFGRGSFGIGEIGKDIHREPIPEETGNREDMTPVLSSLAPAQSSGSRASFRESMAWRPHLNETATFGKTRKKSVQAAAADAYEAVDGDRNESVLFFGEHASRDLVPMQGHSDDSPLLGDSWDRGLKHAVQVHARRLVDSNAFEMLAVAMVSLNCIEIGIDTDLVAQGYYTPLTVIAEHFFFLWFAVELLVRMVSVMDIREYLFGADCRWHWFDFSLVVIQAMDLVRETLLNRFQLSGPAWRLLRILRIVRIGRLLRILHIIDELKLIAYSIVTSFSALAWTMVILFMLIYIWSIACMQVVINAEEQRDTPLTHHTELKYWFGSLPRSMLTLFEAVVGGVSWDECVAPLAEEFGGSMAVFICVYIIVAAYAVTNMMTGMFVQRAMSCTQEHTDRRMAHRIRDLAFKPAEDGKILHDITWQRFQDMVKEPAMQEYFKVLNVDVQDARGVFDLLDADGGGHLDARELVEGCLRLRGSAKALDLCLLTQCVRQIGAVLDEIHMRLDIGFEEDQSQPL